MTSSSQQLLGPLGEARGQKLTSVFDHCDFERQVDMQKKQISQYTVGAQKTRIFALA